MITFPHHLQNDGTYYYGIGNQAVQAYYSSGLVNEKLKWESTEQKLCVDISFINRFDISVDVYYNKIKGPVAECTPSTFGYSTQLQNIGKTINKVEVQLNAVILRKPQGFNWTSSFNISFNKIKSPAWVSGRHNSSLLPAGCVWSANWLYRKKSVHLLAQLWTGDSRFLHYRWF